MGTSRLPELQIVPDEVWQRVLARHGQAAAAGANIRGHQACWASRRAPAAYLFSSLLKCGLCGSNMTIVGGQGVWNLYGCAPRKEGGPHACGNALTVRLSIVEAQLLEPIKRDLLSDEIVAEVQSRVARALAAKPAVKSNDNRIAELRAEVGNLTNAIASGALRRSKALAERLSTAEAELDRLSIHKATRKTNVVSLPIQFADRYQSGKPAGSHLLFEWAMKVRGGLLSCPKSNQLCPRALCRTNPNCTN